MASYTFNEPAAKFFKSCDVSADRSILFDDCHFGIFCLNQPKHVQTLDLANKCPNYDET